MFLGCCCFRLLFSPVCLVYLLGDGVPALAEELDQVGTLLWILHGYGVVTVELVEAHHVRSVWRGADG